MIAQKFLVTTIEKCRITILVIFILRKWRLIHCTYTIHWVIDLLSKCIPSFWFTLHQQEREISHTGIRLIAYWPVHEILKSKGIGPTDANLKRTTKSLEFLKIFISNTVIYFFFKASKSQSHRPGSQHAGCYRKQKHGPWARNLTI